ncbi:FAD-dependent oxidoreductase [Streptomyces sp. NPDC052496]|uniref:NAD(P)/FAD-dependent oxidoreductase n=1 Tax=Streptomyces sp. NPDC052496 TaxID=3154951 RepID=UPI0034421B1F
MDDTQGVDVAVVGDGVLGLSVAVEVARRAPTSRVALIGPPGREGAATPAAGAMLNCFAEVTQYTGRHPAARAKFALARAALDRWPAWLEQLAEEAGPPVGEAAAASHLPGTVVLLGDGPGSIAAENFAAMCRTVHEYGEPHDLVDPGDIPGLLPAPRARPFRALYLHREGCVDARALLDALEAAARRYGVRVVPAAVRRVLATSGAVRGVRLADGSTVEADAVVLAAGSASGELAAGVLPPGAVPPLLHGAGSALLTRRTRPGGTPYVVRTPNRGASCGVHVVPLPTTGRYYLGATNFITCHRPDGPAVGSAETLIRTVREEIDRTVATSRLTGWVWGRRPIALDCFPLIGPCSVKGLVFATGTYRDGFHGSPVIARQVADHLFGAAAPPGTDRAWFTPERAPIETMTVEESLTESAAHATATAYEHGLDLPFFLDDDLVTGFVRDRARRLHEKLDHPVALAPEILLLAFVLAAPATGHPHPADWLADYLRAARTYHSRSR